MYEIAEWLKILVSAVEDSFLLKDVKVDLLD